MSVISIANAEELYKPICERCDGRGEYTLATEKHFGVDYCADCLDAASEAAHERRLDTDGGGVSIAELSERASTERAELRRRD